MKRRRLGDARQRGGVSDEIMNMNKICTKKDEEDLKYKAKSNMSLYVMVNDNLTRKVFSRHFNYAAANLRRSSLGCIMYSDNMYSISISIA